MRLFGLLWVTSHHKHALPGTCLAPNLSKQAQWRNATCLLELLESGASGRGNVKKVLKICDSIQPAKLRAMGKSQPHFHCDRAWGNGGCWWEFSDRWNITLLCFSFEQRWHAHYYRDASEKEISPPRGATFLCASGDTGHVKPAQMPLQWQFCWDLFQQNQGSPGDIFSHPKECINIGVWLAHI